MLAIANRTAERAVALAARLGGAAVPFERLTEALAAADAVVCATRAPGTVLSATAVREAMRTRPQRALVLLDIAVPRDVDPAAANEENVFLYPIDALRALADEGVARRRREVPRVEAIVEEEVERFASWLHGLAAVPLLRELRERFERVRAEEVRRSRKHFGAEQHEHLERLTRGLVDKLLREPTLRLKAADLSTARGLARLDAVRELFALEEADAPPNPEVERG
jgi:glutamyl-tRNA reductase